MKIHNDAKLVDKAASVLKDLLDETEFLTTVIQTHENAASGIDAEITARTRSGTKEYTLIAEVKSSGQPLSARQALDRLFRYTSENPGSYGIFVAPYISPDSAKLCREQGFGYADFEGNCLLRFDQIYIRTEAKRERKAEKRELRSLYSPRSERILRVLLQYPGRSWHLLELAKEADVSVGHVHNIKVQLVERGWVKSPVQSGGLVLSNHDALLNDWPREYIDHKTVFNDYFSLMEIDWLEARIAQTCEEAGIRYAFTGLSAAARRAPFVRYQRTELYVAGADHKIVQLLALKRVPSGSNVRIRVPYDAGVFYGSESLAGVEVVSSVQNYLDLVKEGGRAADGSAYLKERVIDPLWRDHSE